MRQPHRLTRKQYAERADGYYQKDIVAALERRRKVVETMRGLSEEKIKEVKELIESGAKKADVVEQTGVSASSYDRIKNGQLTAEGKPEKDAPAEAKAAGAEKKSAKAEAGQISPKDTRILLSLVESILSALSGACVSDNDIGQITGFATAAKMILEG